MFKNSKLPPIKLIFLFSTIFFLSGCGKSITSESQRPDNPLPSEEDRVMEESHYDTGETTFSAAQNMIKDLLAKYEALSQYSAEYWISVASEKKNYFGPRGNSAYNTEEGDGLPQKIYKKGNNYKASYEKSGALMFRDNPATHLENYYIDNIFYACGDGVCKNEGQKNKNWDWTIFKDPNFFYEFLKNSSAYEAEYLGNERHKTGKTAGHFKIKISDPVKIKDITFIDEQKSRKAEADLFLDNDSGTVISLKIFAQSDAKGNDSEKLYELISWNIQFFEKYANNTDVALPGKYNLIKEARDKSTLFFLIEPYVSFIASGTIKIYGHTSLQKKETISKEITLASRSYQAGKQEKFIIDSGISLPKSLKYEFCISDECKIVASFSFTDLRCLKNSLEKSTCEKDFSCLYDENQQCVNLECSKLKNKLSCEERDCHWNGNSENGRCMEYQCKNYNVQDRCEINTRCIWKNNYCSDKFCSDFRTQEDCASSSLNCEWNNIFCSQLACSTKYEAACKENKKCNWMPVEKCETIPYTSRVDCYSSKDVATCINKKECSWQEEDNTCRNKECRDIKDANNCKLLNLYPLTCEWRNNQCEIFSCPGKMARKECLYNGKCAWKISGKCEDNFKISN